MICPNLKLGDRVVTPDGDIRTIVGIRSTSIYGLLFVTHWSNGQSRYPVTSAIKPLGSDWNPVCENATE